MNIEFSDFVDIHGLMYDFKHDKFVECTFLSYLLFILCAIFPVQYRKRKNLQVFSPAKDDFMKVTGKQAINFRGANVGMIGNPKTGKEILLKLGITPDQTTPKEGDFEYFGFRQISADTVIGSGTWKATEFPSRVLKSAVKLLDSKPAYLEHHDYANAVIGTVKNPVWQDSYVLPNGVIVPSGINAIFKLNKNLKPEIVAHLNDPDSPLRHCSVGVYFKWEASHDFENKYDFYDKLGTVVDGAEVRRVVTEILFFDESSLVHSPADKFASILNDKGEIKHIAFSEVKEGEENLDWFKENQPFVLEHEMPEEFLNFSAVEDKVNDDETPPDTLKLAQSENEIIGLKAERDRANEQADLYESKFKGANQALKVEQEKYQASERELNFFRTRVENLEDEKAEAQKQSETYQVKAEKYEQIRLNKVGEVQALYRSAFKDAISENTLENIAGQDFDELEKSHATYSEMVDEKYGKTVIETESESQNNLQSEATDQTHYNL